MALLKKFKSAKPLTPTHGFWGGGHTPETDPTRKGWRCRPIVKGSGVYLLGQKGKEGCATLRYIGEGDWDVALYDEAPEEILRRFKEGVYLGATRYETAQELLMGGMGLGIIQRIEEEREERRLFELHV